MPVISFISNLLATHPSGSFWFNAGEVKPTTALREATKGVPNSPGLYFVFAEGEPTPANQYLHFVFEGKSYILHYFGKAGGMNRQGEPFKQGLRGRINNVVKYPEEGLKDIKRATYWSMVMDKQHINKLLIRYVLTDTPQATEGMIYNVIASNKLQLPMMNRPLGRRAFR